MTVGEPQDFLLLNLCSSLLNTSCVQFHMRTFDLARLPALVVGGKLIGMWLHTCIIIETRWWGSCVGYPDSWKRG